MTYQFIPSTSSDIQTAHYQSADGRILMVVYITAHEQESFSHFKPDTRNVLFKEYAEAIAHGESDGSESLYRQLLDSLGLPPSKAKRLRGSILKLFSHRIVLCEGMEPVGTLTCDESKESITLRSGNVILGTVALKGRNELGNDEKEKETEPATKSETQGETGTQGEADTLIETETEAGKNQEENEVEKTLEESQEQTTEEDQKGDEKEETSVNKGDTHWWNLSPSVIFILFVLLAAVSFFVTLILTGKISIGAS